MQHVYSAPEIAWLGALTNAARKHQERYVDAVAVQRLVTLNKRSGADESYAAEVARLRMNTLLLLLEGRHIAYVAQLRLVVLFMRHGLPLPTHGPAEAADRE